MTKSVGRREPGRSNLRVAPGGVRIERMTVTDQAIEALREKIVHGEYAEGQPLRQDALAADLGVSRIPVREALRQLEAEGRGAGPQCAAAIQKILDQ